MSRCQELVEREVLRKALVGLLFYEDGACMPALFLDLSQDPRSEAVVKELYRQKRFEKFHLHFSPDGTVQLDSEKDLLDGTRLRFLGVRFVQEKLEDIDAFLGMLEIRHSWVLVVRLSQGEMHFVVSADSDEVMYQYTSRRKSEIRSFPAEPV